MNPWYQRIPHDGNAPRAIAFLRVVHDSIPIFAPFTSRRLVDGTDGMLLADEVTVSRTRNAVLRRGNSEAEPFPGCGADLDEFADLNEVEAAGVDLRVTVTRQVRAPLQGRPLVLSCAIASPRHVTTTVSWFPACALPMERYTFDYASAASQFCVRPLEMKAVLDSLVASPKLDRRVDPADSLSLMVRRVIDGHERVFECTLDREGFAEFVRILTQVFPEPGPPVPGSQGVTTGAPQSVLVSHLRQWAMNIASHMNHQETNRR
jgi:hypothetical protein